MQSFDTIDDQGTQYHRPRLFHLDTAPNTADGDYGDWTCIRRLLLPKWSSEPLFPGAVQKADLVARLISSTSPQIGIRCWRRTINFIAWLSRWLENDFLGQFPLHNFALALAEARMIFSLSTIWAITNSIRLELKYNADLLQDRLNLTAGLYYLKEDNILM